MLSTAAACTQRPLHIGIEVTPPPAAVYPAESLARLKDAIYDAMYAVVSARVQNVTEETRANLERYAADAAQAIEDAALSEQDFYAVCDFLADPATADALKEPTFDKIAQLYAKLSAAAGFEGTGKIVYGLALCYLDELYERDMHRYEQYGYEYLKERAEHIAAEKSDLMRCVGERNFSLVVRTVCALSQLTGEKSGNGFAESLSDGEILTLIQAQKFTSLSLDERGWQAVFALAGRLAEDSAAGTLIQQAQSCGDMARICSRMNDAMRLLKLIQGSLTASQAGLLRQHGGGFALSVFSAFTDEMWQLFTSCTSAAEGDYSATAKTLFGEDYAEYEKNIAICSAEQLKAAANGSDSDIFLQILEGYVAGNCPVAAYLLFHDKT